MFLLINTIYIGISKKCIDPNHEEKYTAIVINKNANCFLRWVYAPGDGEAILLRNHCFFDASLLSFLVRVA
jgi:hypothetical protein